MARVVAPAAAVKVLAGRSWLAVGRPVNLKEAEAGFDVVILKRDDGPQPGPDVINE